MIAGNDQDGIFQEALVIKPGVDAASDVVLMMHCIQVVVVTDHIGDAQLAALRVGGFGVNGLALEGIGSMPAAGQQVTEHGSPHLRALREMIFATAAETPGVGALTETLKWGQPAYLTEQTKSGSTIRLGVPKSGGYAIYAHCHTSIIPDFQAAFPDLTYEGARGVHFPAEQLPPEEVAALIRSALTYHQR